MDAYRAALDETWNWAERRGVRVDFWRNDDREWEAMVTLRDTDGAFGGSTVLPLMTPTKAERRRHTMEQLRAEYQKTLRATLDATTSKARAERNEWQKRRLH
jgi:hypothetical protein